MQRDPEISALLNTHFWQWQYTSPEGCPSSVLEALKVNLPHIDTESWAMRLNWGGVWVNGNTVTTDQPLPIPCKLEYYEPKYDITKPEQYFPPFDPSYIFYHQHGILAAYKPPELPCLPSLDQMRFNLKAYIEQHLSLTLHCPSRLDVATSGLVLMSSSVETHNKLQRAFEKRLVKKRYRLLVSGAVNWEEQVVDQPIARDPRHPVLRQVGAEGKSARTTFTKLRELQIADQPVTLLEAQPHTGRTHQIRVHANHLGLPIVGDLLYGGAPHARLMLLSYAVSIESLGIEEIVLPNQYLALSNWHECFR